LGGNNQLPASICSGGRALASPAIADWFLHFLTTAPGVRSKVEPNASSRHQGEEVVTETTYGSAADARRAATSAAANVSDAASRAVDAASDVASRAQETVATAGQDAVRKLSHAADYFRENEMKEIVSDLQGYVKTHPTQALLGAAALGFLAAILLRRS
jgi:ElaB/YqjD/DUF883 family membrane-anchored ribosome-binding protein